MAKSTLSPSAKNLLARLKKTSSIEESSVFSDSELYTLKEYISTPIPMVNLALSGKFFDGGITRGSTVIAGASRSFKTMLGLLCLRAYLDKYDDAIGMIYDSEFSMTPEYLGTFGIDPDRVFISPIADLDKLKNDIINQVDAIQPGEHVFILIDSLGNLASLKEITDAQDGKSTQDMTRAKMMKSFFRMVTPRVNLKNIPLFTINHVYETQEMYSKTIISGGTGIMLGANTALIISRRKNQNKDEEGFEFVIKIEKSRFIKEGLKFPLVIPSAGGIKRWSGLFDLALETGHIVKEGMKYAVPEIPGFEKVWKKEIEDSDEFWEMMLSNTTFRKDVENGIKVSVEQSSLFKNGENVILYDDAVNNSQENVKADDSDEATATQHFES